MKLTVLFLTVGFLNVHATGVSQKINFSGKKVPLESVFSTVKKQTGYVFLYKNSALESSLPVSISAHDISVENFLEAVFKDQPQLHYKIGDKTIYVIRKAASVPTPLIEIPELVQDTLRDVRGRVVDENGDAVVNASITVKGTPKGTATDSKGEFIVRNVDEDAVLEISSVGYKAASVRIRGKGPIISITLIKIVSSLDEVQVIAYGTTTRRLSTGNITTVKAAEIEQQPVANPLLALKGRVPGMVIKQTSGMPGSFVEVQIRGKNSMGNGNDPLYVVDGVPYPAKLLPSVGNGILGGGSPLHFINPYDIESIDVLKDADATAIYGSRGANGVILITTKKGKVGPTKINLNVQTGWSKMTNFMKMLNTRQYLEMRREALKNDGLIPDEFNAPDLVLLDTTRYTDWQSELLSGTAQYTNIQASANGGNAQVQYSVGVSYNKQTTIFPKNFNDQKAAVNFSLNGTSINRKFNVQLSGTYLVDNNQLPRADPTNSVPSLPPHAPPIYNSDGSLNWKWGNTYFNNPYAGFENKYKALTNNLVSSAIIGYQILPNLEFKSSFGYSNMQIDEVVTYPLSGVEPSWHSWFLRSAEFRDNNARSWIIEPQANYTTKIGNGKVSILVGATMQKSLRIGKGIFGEGFNSDMVLEDISSAPRVRAFTTEHIIYKYNAIFGRIQYNYNDKILLNLNIRRDGTSRFGPEKQFQNFGSIGFGWVFSSENWVQDKLPFINFGKVRISYGTTGSDQIGDYRFMDLYQSTSVDVPYLGEIGLYKHNLYNPDLAWEETKKFEAALELGFIKDRLFLSASYYQNRSSNQLLGYPLSSVTGFTSIDANRAATVRNTGLEVVLSANATNKNFSWKSSLNMTISRNKLISVESTMLADFEKQVGLPLGTYYVYQLIGVDPQTGIYQFDDGYGKATSRPDTSYLRSMHPLNLEPRFYGGFQNSISYKGFSIEFLLHFIKKIEKSFTMGHFTGNANYNQPISVLNRWQKPGDVGPVQRYNSDNSLSQQWGFANDSDAAYSDASYIRLENASLSFEVPQHWVQKIHLQNIKLYVLGQNLFTISMYRGLDPESLGGFNMFRVTPMRIITTGIQITL